MTLRLTTTDNSKFFLTLERLSGSRSVDNLVKPEISANSSAHLYEFEWGRPVPGTLTLPVRFLELALSWLEVAANDCDSSLPCMLPVEKLPDSGPASENDPFEVRWLPGDSFFPSNIVGSKSADRLPSPGLPLRRFENRLKIPLTPFDGEVNDLKLALRSAALDFRGDDPCSISETLARRFALGPPFER